MCFMSPEISVSGAVRSVYGDSVGVWGGPFLPVAPVSSELFGSPISNQIKNLFCSSQQGPLFCLFFLNLTLQSRLLRRIVLLEQVVILQLHLP